MVNTKVIKIWDRGSRIPFSYENTFVMVHDGKIFRKLVVTREKIGFKFGEFILTRKKGQHKKKRK